MTDRMNVRQVSQLRAAWNGTVGENWHTVVDTYATLDEAAASILPAATANEGIDTATQMAAVQAQMAGTPITVCVTGNGQYGPAHARFIALCHEWMPWILNSLEYALEGTNADSTPCDADDEAAA